MERASERYIEGEGERPRDRAISSTYSYHVCMNIEIPKAISLGCAKWENFKYSRTQTSRGQIQYNKME